MEIKPWRQQLYQCGIAALLADVALYFCGMVCVSALAQQLTPHLMIRTSAWLLLVGSCIALVAAILIPFGYGWKRLPLIVACLLALTFWIGFTLY
jgi:hypothetical protein